LYEDFEEGMGDLVGYFGKIVNKKQTNLKKKKISILKNKKKKKIL